MKKELHLKVQSYLDCELSDREARKVQAWLAEDKEAQALMNELSMASAILKGNEPEKMVPDTREFYWSKIQRGIERGEKPEASSPSGFLFAWRKLLAPVVGVALVALLAVSTFRFNDVSKIDPYESHLAEIENLSEHSGSFSFRSQSENMFVVWVYDRTEEVSAEPELSDEMIVQ